MARTGFEAAYGSELRSFVERLIRFETTDGNERSAQEWLERTLEEMGFETYRWMADADELAAHPSFPDPATIDVADRPSVAGVLEFGEPDEGSTLVLNGHVDVVPADADTWSSDPFEPAWDGETLTGRGAADMKSQVGACVFAARYLHDIADGLDGRIVVESVVGEEEGGIGAAAAALSNPYPFDRDAAIVAEPTDMHVVTATEGCLMKRLRLTGRSAHAARREQGESVLPHFERIRHAFEALETERGDRVTHPRYDRFENPWPVVIGLVRAGTWASNVPGILEADMRIGVAPGETLDEVESEFHARLDDLVGEDDWLTAHPPTFERFGIQFESAAIDADEPVVGALQAALIANGFDDTAPKGETYGTDARFYIEAGIPTVVFGPGRIEEAHFPDESIRWPDVIAAAEVLTDAVRRVLQ